MILLPSGCNVEENMTPRSSMISLRKGEIYKKGVTLLLLLVFFRKYPRNSWMLLDSKHYSIVNFTWPKFDILSFMGFCCFPVKTYSVKWMALKSSNLKTFQLNWYLCGNNHFKANFQKFPVIRGLSPAEESRGCTWPDFGWWRAIEVSKTYPFLIPIFSKKHTQLDTNFSKKYILPYISYQILESVPFLLPKLWKLIPFFKPISGKLIPFPMAHPRTQIYIVHPLGEKSEKRVRYEMALSFHASDLKINFRVISSVDSFLIS